MAPGWPQDGPRMLAGVSYGACPAWASMARSMAPGWRAGCSRVFPLEPAQHGAQDARRMLAGVSFGAFRGVDGRHAVAQNRGCGSEKPAVCAK
jgi:hypothetical protein